MSCMGSLCGVPVLVQETSHKAAMRDKSHPVAGCARQRECGKGHARPPDGSGDEGVMKHHRLGAIAALQLPA